MRKTLLAAFLASTCMVASAVPIVIDHYDINAAVTSGHGNWDHTYNGTITPTGTTFTNYTHFGTEATYFGGSGTLNDGVIANHPGNFPPTETQLFVNTASDGTSLHPAIFLTLDFTTGGPWYVNRIELWGGDLFLNNIPGAITGVTVDIIGPNGSPGPQAFSTTAFGPGLNVNGEFVNDEVDLFGSGLDTTAAWAVVLSDFRGDVFNWFSITEVRVFGTQVPDDPGQAPEPGTLMLVAAAMLGLAWRARRSAF